MKILWLQKMGCSSLLVFCNGWGMDERPFLHLASERYDVVMLYDYRSMNAPSEMRSLFRDYAEVFLVAWSMGVWAGQLLFASMREVFRETVAVNGTLCPIDDRFGIPEEIVDGTLRNFSAESRAKLYHRVCRDTVGRSFFQGHLPARSLDGQKEELIALRAACGCLERAESIYSIVAVSNKDHVMPTENQLRFWQGVRIRRLSSCHYPFFQWRNWEAFLADIQATQPADDQVGMA